MPLRQGCEQWGIQVLVLFVYPGQHEGTLVTCMTSYKNRKIRVVVVFKTDMQKNHTSTSSLSLQQTDTLLVQVPKNPQFSSS